MKSMFKIGCGSLLALIGVAIVIGVINAPSAKKTTSSSETTTVVEKKRELTKEQYAALQPGMTPAQVADILGTNGEEKSSASVNTRSFASTSTVRIYSGDGFMPGTITVVYSDGKLMSKSQFGLQ